MTSRRLQKSKHQLVYGGCIDSLSLHSNHAVQCLLTVFSFIKKTFFESYLSSILSSDSKMKCLLCLLSLIFPFKMT